ncbi:MAG: FHA domain-containing protein [Clostridiales bacterium]|nr:FHA domain-containing protein [Clostridiales bacterium]
MIQCERGHFFDENRYTGCPYCNQASSKPRAVTPPVAPNMAIPTPSCGKTVAIEGMETEPAISKTVAIENFEETAAPVNKTVAISEPASDFEPSVTSGLPPMAAPASAPVSAPAPVAPVPSAPSAPEVPSAPAPAVPFSPTPEFAPVPQFSPAAAPETAFTPAPSADNTFAASPAFSAAPVAPSASPVSSEADMNAEIPFTGVSEMPEPILTEEISVDLPVTGLGVSDDPKPIIKEETYYQPSDRPYAVTGLGVKENPTPIPNDIGATFPIPSEGGESAAAGQPGQAEAAAFAAFGFPGGPIPGMMPGTPMPGAPMPGAAMPGAPMPGAPMPGTSIPVAPAPAVESAAPAVEDMPVPTVEDIPASPVEAEIPASPAETQIPAETIVEPSVESVAPAVENPQIPAPMEHPVTAPVFVEAKPRDPNATVSMTESDMDYLPRVHARAFLVCVDGPMTGASFVFQENKAIIGRQKNYEIALFRDNSVSRSPHAIITYNKDTLRYVIAQGDSEKRVSVNGTFINAEQEIKLYDIIGIGQTRILFIPVCSEKFAW